MSTASLFGLSWTSSSKKQTQVKAPIVVGEFAVPAPIIEPTREEENSQSESKEQTMKKLEIILAKDQLIINIYSILPENLLVKALFRRSKFHPRVGNGSS